MTEVRVKNAQRVHEVLNDIQAWPHWDEIRRGAIKEGVTPEAFDWHLPAFQKFMALSAEYHGLGMLSEGVDQIWHALILNTRRYQEFCEQILGRFVHHLPCSSFELYGVSVNGMATRPICDEPPATCTDPWPAPPDPSPVPDEYAPDRASVKASILACTQRFIDAYTDTFGQAPSIDIWTQLKPASTVDGVAQ